MMVPGPTETARDVVDIILEELNVKALERIDDASAYIRYEVKPQLKTLGPRYGKVLPAIRAYLW